MEDTLRDVKVVRTPDGRVLILVLMEDTLREWDILRKGCTHSVLILVLMEDTLRVIKLTQ